MKIKEFFYLLGLRPRARTYGITVETCTLAREGAIDLAQWQRPGAYRLAPTQELVDQLRQFLRPGDVAIDVGAHVGDSTLPLALAVGVTGAVLALEPNRFTFAVLEANARLNPDKIRIIPLNIAAMRADGVVQFQYGDPGYNNGGFHEGMSRWKHGSAFTLEVDVRNLQQLLEREYPGLRARIRMIKVDAEGFDRAVLETIDDLLRTQRPFLQVELFNLKKSDPAERVRLFEYLTGHGYRLHRIESEAQLLGDVVTRENLMSWRSCDVFCVPAEQFTSGLAPPRKTAGSP